MSYYPEFTMKKFNPLVSDDSVRSILQIGSAYQKSKILLSACELDIFTIIGNHEKSAKEIAFELNSETRAMEKFLNALCAINLLLKDGDNYKNTLGAKKYLVRGNPDFMGSLMHLSDQWESWGRLTDVIKAGKPVVYQGLQEKDPKWVKDYTDSLEWQAKMQAPDVVRMIDLEDVENVLDLGGGAGIYSMEFLKIKPWMKVTLFDLPNIIDRAEEVISEHGFDGKIITKKGDLATDDIGSGYDLIFVSNIVSYFSLWDNFHIMRKIFESLNHEGRVVIQDKIINDDRISPEDCAIHSLSMLINTLGGESYNETDLWIMLKEAWFENISKEVTPFGSTLITGVKSIHY